MALIGYARVSTAEQSLDLQRDALKAAGADRIFEDLGVSGSKASRPGLDAAMEYLRAGDTLITWKLDRVSRSVPHMLQLVEALADRGIGFKSLTESIDTSGPAGRFTLVILSAVAALERDLIRERTKAGLDAARRQGRVGGRPRVLTPTQVAVARAERAAGTPVAKLAADLSIGTATLYRYLDDE